jgi:hypothetical protein
MIRFDKRAVRCAAFEGHALDTSSAIAKEKRQLCYGAGMRERSMRIPDAAAMWSLCLHQVCQVLAYHIHCAQHSKAALEPPAAATMHFHTQAALLLPTETPAVQQPCMGGSHTDLFKQV